MQAYLEHNGQQFGPFSVDQAQSYIAEGRFSGNDRAWLDGMADWQEIASIPQLAVALNVPRPPQPDPYANPYAQSRSSAARSPAGDQAYSQSPAYPAYPAAHSAAGVSSAYAAPNADLQLASDSEYAGFWRRAAAMTIDYLLIGVFAMFFSGILSILLSVLGSETLMIVASFTPSLLGVAYFAFWNTTASAGPPGKMAMGLVVVDANGQRLSGGSSVLREFLKVVSSFALFVGVITQPMTERRQTLYDLLANTVVIRKSAQAGAPDWVVWAINLLWVLIVAVVIGLVMFLTGLR